MCKQNISLFLGAALATTWASAPVMARAAPTLDGSLASYLAYATNHPRMVRAREFARAEAKRGQGAGRLPDPVLSYSYYARSVETRVGPQRHRVGLQQTIPWPSGLAADRRALRSNSTALEHETRDITRQLSANITRTYWEVWLLDREHALTEEQRTLLQSLADSTRARLEVGQSTLAALTQIELSVSRLDDTLASLVAQRAMTIELLRAAIGAPPDLDLPITDKGPDLPSTEEVDARSAAAGLSHPTVEAIRSREQAQQARADQAWSKRLPALKVGFDYIQTGANPAAGPGSGKDPVILNLAAAIPLWQRSYASSQQAAETTQRALASERAVKLLDIQAEVSRHRIALQNALRRIGLYTQTLIPQAKAVFDSVSGAFQTGRVQVADVLLAQRELLDLQMGLVGARTDGAHHWATLRYWATEDGAEAHHE